MWIPKRRSVKIYRSDSCWTMCDRGYLCCVAYGLYEPGESPWLIKRGFFRIIYAAINWWAILYSLYDVCCLLYEIELEWWNFGHSTNIDVKWRSWRNKNSCEMERQGKRNRKEKKVDRERTRCAYRVLKIQNKVTVNYLIWLKIKGWTSTWVM